jgi:hypothetical protein
VFLSFIALFIIFFISRLAVLQEEKTKPAQTVEIFKTAQTAVLIFIIFMKYPLAAGGIARFTR